MKRDKIHYKSAQNSPGISKEVIVHEAGHATAIYLNNKAKNLPPVFFKIMFNTINNEQREQSALARPVNGDGHAKIEGGRLIQSFLPSSEITDGYLTAFEADIVNILIGSLAEAKYIHLCDDEFFNRLLVNINALNYYGGQLDLALATEYLQSLYSTEQQQKEKLNQLFIKAFEFIDDYSNWQAIIKLTDYIYEKNKSIFYFDEVASTLEPVKITYE